MIQTKNRKRTRADGYIEKKRGGATTDPGRGGCRGWRVHYGTGDRKPQRPAITCKNNNSREYRITRSPVFHSVIGFPVCESEIKKGNVARKSERGRERERELRVGITLNKNGKEKRERC